MSGFNNDYVEVHERLVKFYERYPDGRVTTSDVRITSEPDGVPRVLVEAAAYRTPDDPVPARGWSWMILPGSTNFTRGSELENTETSAWGRAMAAAGIEVKRGIASASEVRNKSGEASRQASAPAGPSSPAGDARPLPGSWEGTFATTDSADASVRESKDGPVLKFVLTDPEPYPGMKRINVRVHGELAHAVAVGISSFGKPERVTVWGDLREETFKAKDGKTVRYLALDATRVMAPEFTVPAATEPAPAAAPVSVAPSASGGEFDDLPF